MNIAYAIKDADTDEFLCRNGYGPFDTNMAFVELYSSTSVAETQLINTIRKGHTRWLKGYRVTRKLVITKLNITEVE